MTTAANVNFDESSQYFSGQGVVMIGSRDANGNPTGLRALGNVSDLKLTVATTIVDHKNSQDGQRATDARLRTDIKSTASLTLDSWFAANLAKALSGDNTVIPAGAVAAGAVNCYPGLISPLAYINTSNLVLTSATSTVLTAYTTPSAPYDYKVNQSAGSIEINPLDGALAPVGLGTAPSAITVGSTTVITMANTATVGEEVYLVGFTGANASSLNNISALISACDSGHITIPVVTTAETITVGAGSRVIFANEAQPCSAAYNFSAQTLVHGLTQPLTDVFLRFEGLNTAQGNTPVVVEIFRFSTDPLKELSLISDTFGSFQLEGAIMYDYTKLASGLSPYFHVKQLY
jgi:hypothetical protein